MELLLILLGAIFIIVGLGLMIDADTGDKSNQFFTGLASMGLAALFFVLVGFYNDKPEYIMVNHPKQDTIELKDYQTYKGKPIFLHYTTEYAKAPQWVVGEQGQVINVSNNHRNTIKSYVWVNGRGWVRL